jgi:hypothetical protein
MRRHDAACAGPRTERCHGGTSELLLAADGAGADDDGRVASRKQAHPACAQHGDDEEAAGVRDQRDAQHGEHPQRIVGLHRGDATTRSGAVQSALPASRRAWNSCRLRRSRALMSTKLCGLDMVRVSSTCAHGRRCEQGDGVQTGVQRMRRSFEPRLPRWGPHPRQHLARLLPHAQKLRRRQQRVGACPHGCGGSSAAAARASRGRATALQGHDACRRAAGAAHATGGRRARASLQPAVPRAHAHAWALRLITHHSLTAHVRAGVRAAQLCASVADCNAELRVAIRVGGVASLAAHVA